MSLGVNGKLLIFFFFKKKVEIRASCLNYGSSKLLGKLKDIQVKTSGTFFRFIFYKTEKGVLDPNHRGVWGGMSSVSDKAQYGQNNPSLFRVTGRVSVKYFPPFFFSLPLPLIIL